MRKILALTLALFLVVNVSLVAILPGVSAQTDALSGTDVIESTQTENSSASVPEEEASAKSPIVSESDDNFVVGIPSETASSSDSEIPEKVTSDTDVSSCTDISDETSPSDAPVLLLTANTVWDGITSEAFAGGTGTADDPYLIANGAQLYYLSLMISSDSSADYVAKCYKLTDDIDLNDKRFTPLKTFKGTLDGDGHTIKGINIVSTGSDYSGLIRTGDSCTIKSLTLDGSVSGESYTGALLGYLRCQPSEYFVIENCKNECTVTGSGLATGGLIGCASYISSSSNLSRNVILNSCNCAEVSGNKNVGGIIGYYKYVSTWHSGLKIISCFNSGSIKGTSSIGGIIGSDYASIIKECANAGSVTASKSCSAGICGYVYHEYEMYKRPSLSNVYNCGDISAADYAGGILGDITNGEEIKCVYNIGKVSAATNSGEIHANGAAADYAYYLSGNNPDATNTYGTANSAEDMVIPAGYAGFNFTDTWGWDTSGDYPYPILKGMGVISNDYKTYTVTFADWDGTVIDTQKVQNGKSAVSPTDLPERKNYNFTGWDKAFSNITSDLTVTAQYEQVAFDVTVDPGENGDIEIADDNVDIGDDIIVYITPDEGYRIDEITVDGEAVDLSQLTYENGKFVLTISGKSQDTEIGVTFEKLPDSSGCAVDMGNSFKTGETISFETKGVWGDYDVLLENDIRYIPTRWHHAEPSGNWNGETSESFAYTDSFTQSKAGSYTLKVEFTRYVLKSGVWIASNDTVTVSKDYTVIADSTGSDNGEDVKTGDNSPIEPIIVINIMLLCAAAIFYCVKDKVLKAHR